MKNVLCLQRVTKDFGRGRGIFDISFTVQSGEVFGYLGPNGAGKSTTIRQLMGFIRPDSGSCTIGGRDCFEQAALLHRKVGYLPGEIAFLEEMTGIAYLKFMAQLRELEDTARMKQLIERFELDPSGKIRKMSKGMKQKIGLICAFMGAPQVLILDEPTSGLDPLMQKRFWELILEEKKRGSTIFMSSHIFEEVEKTCDRTAIIRDGRLMDIVDMASLGQIRNKVYTFTFSDEAAARRAAGADGIAVREINGNRLSLLVQSGLPQLLNTMAGYQPTDLSVTSQSLEELFLQYYGKGENEN